MELSPVGRFKPYFLLETLKDKNWNVNRVFF